MGTGPNIYKVELRIIINPGNPRQSGLEEIYGWFNLLAHREL